jgi:hypothetical protein
MNKRIAILTATPPGINPGMLAGEAAALAFLDRARLLENATFFRIMSLEERIQACDIGIKHHKLPTPNLLDEYMPLFWGDFLHMRRYIKAISGNSSELEARHRAVLLLEGSKNTTLESAISYGTSFLFNSTSDYAAADYGPALARFLESVSHIQMRDAVSSAMVANYRRRANESCGIDPVQLLSIPAVEEFILSGIESTPIVDRALVFFARAQHCEEHLNAFVAGLTEALGTSCHWLPWGDQLSFPFMQRETWPWQTLKLPPHPLNQGVLAPLLNVIRSSRFVVTDTYHVAVSSWAMGVPAVVVAGTYHNSERASKEVDTRVRLDKRTVLLAQDGLLDFCIEPVLLSDLNRCSVIQRLAEVLQNSHLGPNFRRRLAMRASQSEQLLLSNLSAR